MKKAIEEILEDEICDFCKYRKGKPRECKEDMLLCRKIERTRNRMLIYLTARFKGLKKKEKKYYGEYERFYNAGIDAVLELIRGADNGKV